jgi:hypothetical protein
MEDDEVMDASSAPAVIKQLDDIMRERKIESRLMLVMAKSYLMMQNRPAAKICIRECLVGNPYSSDALQTAVNSKLLSSCEIKKLLSSKSKKTTGAKVMNLLYELRCSKVSLSVDLEKK